MPYMSSIVPENNRPKMVDASLPGQGRKDPYIGITGFVSQQEVEALGKIVRPQGCRRLMAGVLASFKTMHGEPTTNRRYPKFSEVEPLLHSLSELDNVWPVVHFNAPRRELLGDLLLELAEKNPSMEGVQLNIVKPDIGAIERFKEAFPHIEVILQANKRSLLGKGEKSVRTEAPSEFLEDYRYVADHILLDLSGGTGKGLDIEWVSQVLAAFHSQWRTEWQVTPGIAGGLGPEAEVVLRALRSHVGPEVLAGCSIDAETALRKPIKDPIEGEDFQDILCNEKVISYLSRTDSFFDVCSGYAKNS